MQWAMLDPNQILSPQKSQENIQKPNDLATAPNTIDIMKTMINRPSTNQQLYANPRRRTEWKKFNNFEVNHPHATFRQNQKLNLRDEILIHGVHTFGGLSKEVTSTINSNRPMTTGDHKVRGNINIDWKIPRTVETHDRVYGENMGRYEGNRHFGKMFVCPPKAENIHQLIEDQKMYEKKKALEQFMLDYEAEQRAIENQYNEMRLTQRQPEFPIAPPSTQGPKDIK